MKKPIIILSVSLIALLFYVSSALVGSVETKSNELASSSVSVVPAVIITDLDDYDVDALTVRAVGNDPFYHGTGTFQHGLSLSKTTRIQNAIVRTEAFDFYSSMVVFYPDGTGFVRARLTGFPRN